MDDHDDVHSWHQRRIEASWRLISDEDYSQVREKYLVAIRECVEKGLALMANLRTHIRAREDPDNAERLCRDIVLSREALTQRLLEDGISHFWTDFGVMPSVQNYKADSQSTQNNPISAHISISDDSDEDADAILSHDDHQEPADRDCVGEDANKEPEDSPKAREKRAYTRQIHSPPSPRPKRRRRNGSEHSAGIYDLPSSPFEEDRDEMGRRQIKIGDVEEQDFIFQFPEMGPGYFVVRCGRGKHIHRFQEDPLKPYRGQPIMVNHFKSKAPSSKCHKKDDAKTYTTIEIMKEFGYRVVDYDNSDVDSERVKASNENLAWKLDQNKSRHKGKEKMAAPPKYEPATSRKGVSPEVSRTWAMPVGTGAGIASFSRSVNIAPTPEMDPDGKLNAMVAEARKSYSPLPQLVESDTLPSEKHGLAQEEQRRRTGTASATLSPPG